MRWLLVGVALGVLGAGAACAHVMRSSGSWSYQDGRRMVADGFEVETLEVVVGPLYTEFVWGHWR